MITKPERIIKRIIKAVGQRQSVLVVGEWENNFTQQIRENENSINFTDDSLNHFSLENNSFTRIIANYDSPIFEDNKLFFIEARRLLLPTGMIIISANCQEGLFDKLINLLKKEDKNNNNLRKIKPKVLQDQIHDNGFLIDGYYGYPGGHLLMMAQIQNKEVSTLFTSERQETIN